MTPLGWQVFAAGGQERKMEDVMNDDLARDSLDAKRALHRRRAYEAPLEILNPAWASAFRDDGHWAYFERLRAEDPVHWTPDSNYGASGRSPSTTTSWRSTPITQVFLVGQGIGLPQAGRSAAAGVHRARDHRGCNSFINMDPPGHDIQRKTVSRASRRRAWRKWRRKFASGPA